MMEKRVTSWEEFFSNDSWQKSLLLKSGVLGIGIVIVLWIGWPPSQKNEINQVFPSVVRSNISVDPSPAISLSPERVLEHTSKNFQEQKRPVSSTVMLVDLNTSSQKELEMLPGIGPVLADRIVTYRLTNGNFQQIAELVNVQGIGTIRLQRLQPFVKIEAASQKFES